MTGRPTSDEVLRVDTVAILLGSVAICFFADRLVLMTVLVPLLMAARTVVFGVVTGASRSAALREVGFLVLCIGLGAFNDWNSVVHHGIYDYNVPVFFERLSTIPIWMLLFWGMILRFMASVGTWRGLSGLASRVILRPAVPCFAGRWTWLALVLVLVAVTRQLIYRSYLDPLLSWVPFAVAVMVYFWLTGLTRAQLVLALMGVGFGTLTEIVYINVGGLHSYHLGWIGGVPLWIALWWVLIVPVWGELVSRASRTR